MRIRICLGAALAILSSAARAADANRGRQVFQACAACHGDKGGDLGPSLVGVAGRKAASLENFRYSPAMMRSNIVWNDANLHAFLVNPQAKVKGTRMPYEGLGESQDVDDVIAYLKTLK